MLIKELIPHIEAQHGLTISTDPMDRLIMVRDFRKSIMALNRLSLFSVENVSQRKTLGTFLAHFPGQGLTFFNIIFYCFSSFSHHFLLFFEQGHSSGGVASMSAGYNHPEAFGCVVSHCASYVNIRGAHQLAWAVRNRCGPYTVLTKPSPNLPQPSPNPRLVLT